MLKALARPVWRYRGFILGNVKREFQSKYRNSLLGAAWTVLNPLAMILVYTVVFSQVMKARIPNINNTFAYGIYLCAGVLTWGYFAEIVGRAQNVFLENANLLKKLSFPRLCLPVIIVANATINFAIVFGLFTLFLLVTGSFPGWPYLGLIPILGIMILFSIGLGISLGVLNVFFRDVGQFFGIVLQFWFWFTPIVYNESILPERAKQMLEFNPMSAIVVACQHILLNRQWPDWSQLWFVTLLAVVFCTSALYLFRRHAGEMVDEL